MKKTPAKKIVKGSNTYKLDRVKSFIEIKQKGTITAEEAIENIAEILEVTPIVELNRELSYRVVEVKYDSGNDKERWNTSLMHVKHINYILQYKWWQDDEWIDVIDLTELKVWEYNELVDRLNKVFPEYPIECLEGRFV